MRNRRRPQHQRSLREIIATWVAAILVGIFVGVYLASFVMAWLRPEAAQSAMLERLLMVLVPLVTLAVQWYLKQRDRGKHD
jgi:uncharacterized membrane-anchored protein